MSMRRLFIIRKDLQLSAGKLSAMVAHCAEAYWTNFIRLHTIRQYDNILPCVQNSLIERTRQGKDRIFQDYRRGDLHKLSLKAYEEGKEYFTYEEDEKGNYIACKELKYHYDIDADIDKDIYENYINASFVKTICEAKNLNHLLKAKDKAIELGLKEVKDFGLIKDICRTELTPENEDGTCTVGIWFKPLEDEIAHELSKKYQLYKG